MWSAESTKLGPLDAGTPNDGRLVYTRDLFEELRLLAEAHGYRWRVANPAVVGKQLANLKESLGVHFHTERGHGNRGTWWRFSRKSLAGADPDEADGSKDELGDF